MALRNLRSLLSYLGGIMKKNENPDEEYNFLLDPKIKDNHALLHELGVLDYVDLLEKEITNDKSLLAGALEIFNQTTINDIIEVTMRQISDRFLPSLIVFLWKPIMNRDDLIIKSYKDNELVDMDLKIENINILEPFFQIYPRPMAFDLFSYEMNSNEITKTLESINPKLIIPILGPSGLYGLMLMGPKAAGAEYSNADLLFISNLMSFASKAVQNNLHYERTLRDVKTGLYNNGFFMTRLSEEVARTNRNESRSSVIIMDVDKFKNFNDTYGHIAGDRVLENLAITIKQGIRLADVASRFGGEEFTVLLPDTDTDMAWLVAERLRNMVAAMKIPWDPPLPQVFISLGIFTFDRNSKLTEEEIVERADTAMYHSKQTGRNRTTIWEAGLPNKILTKGP